MLSLISSLYLNIVEMNNWMSYIWSGLNDIFQLYARPFGNHNKSFVRSLALSSLFLTTEKREVSSANHLTLDFNPSGK